MNQFAQTLLYQANEAIEAGSMDQAMELLRKAKVLARSDSSLTPQILKQMIRIAPACKCEAEVALWQRQLDAVNAPVNVPALAPKRKPTPGDRGRRSPHLATLILGFAATLVLLAFAMHRFWSFSAARFTPAAATQSASDSAPATQPA